MPVGQHKLVPLHLTGYVHQRMICLSDLPWAVRLTSHSESQDLYQIHINLGQKKPGAGVHFLLSKQKRGVEK